MWDHYVPQPARPLCICVVGRHTLPWSPRQPLRTRTRDAGGGGSRNGPAHSACAGHVGARPVVAAAAATGWWPNVFGGTGSETASPLQVPRPPRQALGPRPSWSPSAPTGTSARRLLLRPTTPPWTSALSAETLRPPGPFRPSLPSDPAHSFPPSRVSPKSAPSTAPSRRCTHTGLPFLGPPLPQDPADLGPQPPLARVPLFPRPDPGAPHEALKITPLCFFTVVSKGLGLSGICCRRLCSEVEVIQNKGALGERAPPVPQRRSFVRPCPVLEGKGSGDQ